VFNGADLHKTRMRLMLVIVGGKETNGFGVSKMRTNEYIGYFQSLFET